MSRPLSNPYGEPRFAPNVDPSHVALVLGVLGGLGVGRMVYDHLRVRGVTTKERLDLLKAVGAVGVGGALVYIAGVDKRYVVLDEESLNYWQQHWREELARLEAQVDGRHE